jgi:hypothetical protein
MKIEEKICRDNFCDKKEGGGVYATHMKGWNGTFLSFIITFAYGQNEKNW